jgi:hypothetical protein
MNLKTSVDPLHFNENCVVLDSFALDAAHLLGD